MRRATTRNPRLPGRQRLGTGLNAAASAASVAALSLGGGSSNHSLLSNLSADDHPHYTLADGSRAFTAPVTGANPTIGTHLTTRDYVDNEISILANFGLAFFQPLDATLSAIAAVVTAADQVTYSTGVDTFAQTGLTAAGRALLDDANAAAQRTTLGLAAIASSGSASDLAGTVPTARLGSGTANSSTYLRGDQTYATPAGGDILFSDCPNNTVNINSLSAVDVLSKNLTLAAGEVVEIELWGTLLNHSLAVRTYTPSMVLSASGGFNLLTLTVLDGATVGFNATNRAYWRLKGWFTITSTTVAHGLMESDRTPAGASNTAQSIAVTTNRKTWNTTASNMTGAAVLTVRFLSSANTATQQFTVYGYQIRQKSQQI